MPEARVKAVPFALLKLVPVTVRFVVVPPKARTLPAALAKFEFVTLRSVKANALNERTDPLAFVAVTLDTVTDEAVSPKVRTEPPACEAVTLVNVNPLTGP